jgi:hypothetical protein
MLHHIEHPKRDLALNGDRVLQHVKKSLKASTKIPFFGKLVQKSHTLPPSKSNWKMW